jgi:hypothetical protein
VRREREQQEVLWLNKLTTKTAAFNLYYLHGAMESQTLTDNGCNYIFYFIIVEKGKDEKLGLV